MHDVISVELVREHARLPEKAHRSDAGWDCFTPEDVCLSPGGGRVRVPLGFKLELPTETVCLVQGKSGLAWKQGVTTIGNVIDQGYRGECHVVLLNTGDEEVFLGRGSKVCQLVFLRLPLVIMKQGVVNESTDRGDGGFGSTGA